MRVLIIPANGSRLFFDLSNTIRSKELFTSLEELRSDPAVGPHILDIRGVGLMVGVEFASPTPANDPFANPKSPAGLASAIAKKCQENGLFILTTSVYQVRLPRNVYRTTDSTLPLTGHPIHPSSQHHEGRTSQGSEDLPSSSARCDWCLRVLPNIGFPKHEFVFSGSKSQTYLQCISI